VGEPAVVSVNVGLPRELAWEGRTLVTAIVKRPVTGRVPIGPENLDGDRQADLNVHGGPEKAVYAYPSEHYPYWAGELPGTDLPWGSFGENLTTRGLHESDLRIGDRLRFGGAELRITQPRMPCHKLNARFQRPDMVTRFLASGRSGFYFAVVRPGEVAAGDPIAIVERAADSMTVSELVALHASEKGNAGLLRRAVALPFLSEKWKRELGRRLKGLEARPGE
jgi:MOSC domain-containing protein YiiM